MNGNPCTAPKICGTGLNEFANPIAVYNAFRVPILGLDNNTNGAGALRGLPTWNLDLSVTKDIAINERYHLQLVFTGLNVLNHLQLGDPSMDIENPAVWGVLNSELNTPRQIEFGARFQF